MLGAGDGFGVGGGVGEPAAIVGSGCGTVVGLGTGFEDGPGVTGDAVGIG